MADPAVIDAYLGGHHDASLSDIDEAQVEAQVQAEIEKEHR